jgi:lysophospholipid acyltransferase (LPLAT)-like uncharacterized protein
MFLAHIAAFFIRLLCLTWRVRLVGPEPVFGDRPLIFCFWHGRQVGLFAHYRPRQVAVLSSLSRDGTLQAHILRNLGFEVLRGSSSRGGVAGLKGLVDTIKRGGDAVFAVDGPRGPVFHVKPGAILAAEQTHGILIPMTTRASAYWTFKKAWDNYQLPKPFARVEIVRGDPIYVERSGVEKARASLENALLCLEKESSLVAGRTKKNSAQKTR